MKRELLRQMNAMDTLLRENFFTASMSALLPGALVLAVTWKTLRKAFRKLSGSRRRTRRSLIKQVRAVLRDAERLLIRHLASTPGGAQRVLTRGASSSQLEPPADAAADAARTRPSAARLSEIDTGLLVISLHLLRQTVERHKVLLSAGERASFFEDLEDLESEQYDCEGKMLVLQRIYRTQPALLAGGGAASAGAAHDNEFGPGMQLVARRY